MKRIFFVEDDLSLINGLTFALKKQGYETVVARTRAEALGMWERGNYDLVILDVSLPDGSGYELCEEMRRTSKVPVIFLTAADEETDIIMGLDIGGDDYITKPFKLAVFLSRVNALLRRSSNFEQEDAVLESNGIKVELLRGKAYKNGGGDRSDGGRVPAALHVYGKSGPGPCSRADPGKSLGPGGRLYRKQHPDSVYPEAEGEDRR